MSWIFFSIHVCSAVAAQFTTAMETSARWSKSASLGYPRTRTNALSSALWRPSTTALNASFVAFRFASVPESTLFVHAGRSTSLSRTRGFVQHDV